MVPVTIWQIDDSLHVLAIPCRTGIPSGSPVTYSKYLQIVVIYRQFLASAFQKDIETYTLTWPDSGLLHNWQHGADIIDSSILPCATLAR